MILTRAAGRTGGVGTSNALSPARSSGAAMPVTRARPSAVASKRHWWATNQSAGDARGDERSGPLLPAVRTRALHREGIQGVAGSDSEIDISGRARERLRVSSNRSPRSGPKEHRACGNHRRFSSTSTRRSKPPWSSRFKSIWPQVPADVALLLSHFRVTDVALRVVGVGSVGTRCYLVIMVGPNDTTDDHADQRGHSISARRVRRLAPAQTR